jgi:hypothetical protein
MAAAENNTMATYFFNQYFIEHARPRRSKSFGCDVLIKSRADSDPPVKIENKGLTAADLYLLTNGERSLNPLDREAGDNFSNATANILSSNLSEYIIHRGSKGSPETESFICRCLGCSQLDVTASQEFIASNSQSWGTISQLANYLKAGYYNLKDGFEYNLGTSGSFPRNGIINYNLSASNYDSNGLTGPRQALALESLKLFGTTLGISFQEVTGNDAQFFFTDNSGGAFAIPRYTTNTFKIVDSRINIDAAWDGRVSNYQDYVWSTFNHEVGHALGLGHQGPYNGTGNFASQAIYSNDSYQLSMMSYFSQLANPNINASYAFPATPMVADWVALDRKYSKYGYGIDQAFPGNTIYGYNTNISSQTSTVWNQFIDIALNGSTRYKAGAAFTIVDGAGRDTLDLSGYAGEQLIDLRPSDVNNIHPYASNILGKVGNLTIAPNTIIENAKGGNGQDTFIGNNARNRFWGNGGNDTFWDSKGANVYHGGTGTDKVYFKYDFSSYSVSTRSNHLAIACNTTGFTKTVFDDVENIAFRFSTIGNPNSSTNYTYSQLATAVVTAPTVIIAIRDNFGLIKGVVAPGGRTDDRTPTISGTLTAALDASETLRIFNGSKLLGSAKVNNTNRTWSFTPTLPATAGKTYRITARVADATGNLGTASATRSFVLDTVAPTTRTAIIAVRDNFGPIKGVVAPGGRTDDRTPAISGTLTAALAAGETLRIFNGRRLLGSAKVNNTNRTWSYTPTLPATDGTTYLITARVADAAGNLGNASTARTFVLDTRASRQSLTVDTSKNRINGKNPSLRITDPGADPNRNVDLVFNGRRIFKANATNKRDRLTGNNQKSDTFSFASRQDSLLGAYDTITNFERLDRISIGGASYGASLRATSGSPISRLTATEINKALGGRHFGSKKAAAFQARGFNGTFIALNDNRPGFQTNSDAVIFLEGFNISRANPVAVV